MALNRARIAGGHAKLDVFLAPFSLLPFDDGCARTCAKIRRELERIGKRIGPHDLQIAAVALQHNLTLVTHNTREFGRIPSLRGGVRRSASRFARNPSPRLGWARIARIADARTARTPDGTALYSSRCRSRSDRGPSQCLHHHRLHGLADASRRICNKQRRRVSPQLTRLRELGQRSFVDVDAGHAAAAADQACRNHRQFSDAAADIEHAQTGRKTGAPQELVRQRIEN